MAGEYEFDGGRALGDYPHVLPADLLTGREGIAYTDPILPEKLQTSLGSRVRLWNLDSFGADFERPAGV